MFSRLRAQWDELKKAEPGSRFQAFHDNQQKQMPKWAGPLYVAGAILSLGVGVVLVFIPGPAVLFFAIAAGLLATQSVWLAKKLDLAEVAARKFWARIRHKKPGAATPTKAETPQARARVSTNPRPSASPGGGG